MKRIVSTAASLLLLSGCAGMNENECVMADWRTIGFEDGTAGRSQSRIGEYRQDCADHGVTPNLAQYQDGYAEGLRNYCTESNGFAQGRAGVTYRGICPRDLEPGFTEAYSIGRDFYVLYSAVSSLNKRINSGKARIKSLEEGIAAKVLEVANDETSGERRVLLMVEIKNDHQTIGELKANIRDYEAELAVKQAEYASLERPVFY